MTVAARGGVRRGVRNTVDGIEVIAVDEVEPGVDAQGDEHVRVRVRAAGICGSDLHLIEWGPLPVTLGHEFAGLLDDGTAVAVQPQLPCGTCDRCLGGQEQLCRTSGARIHGVSIDGGLADEVLVDARALVALPPGVAVDDAGLVEPLAVAVHGLNLGGVESGQRVLVVGAGSIGLCAVAVAGHLGAAPDLIARHRAQLEAGERLGARALGGSGASGGSGGTGGSGGSGGSGVTGRSGGSGSAEYDVVIDAAGSQSALDHAFSLVRPGGTVISLATYWSPVEVGLAMTTKEARLIPSSSYGTHDGRREFDDAAAVLAATPELASALITHRFGLDDAAEAFRVAGDRGAGAIKVQLTP